MKKLLLCLSLLCLPLSIVVVETGCATAQTIAFKTLGATAGTVDKALGSYYDLVYAGKITPAQQAQVEAIRVKYQVAMNTALDAVAGNYAAITPDAAAALAKELITTINTLLK